MWILGQTIGCGDGRQLLTFLLRNIIQLLSTACEALEDLIPTCLSDLISHSVLLPSALSYWAWLRFWAFVLVVPSTWKALPLDLLAPSDLTSKVKSSKGPPLTSRLMSPRHRPLILVLPCFISSVILIAIWNCLLMGWLFVICLPTGMEAPCNLCCHFLLHLSAFCLELSSGTVNYWMNRFRKVNPCRQQGPGCAVKWQCCDGMQICRRNFGAGTVQNILCSNVDKNFQPQESWRRK